MTNPLSQIIASIEQPYSSKLPPGTPNEIHKTSWIMISGTTYKKDNVLVIGKINNVPVFSVLHSIVIINVNDYN
jgi:hypothetical protein